MKWMEVGFINV